MCAYVCVCVSHALNRPRGLHTHTRTHIHTYTHTHTHARTHTHINKIQTHTHTHKPKRTQTPQTYPTKPVISLTSKHLMKTNLVCIDSQTHPLSTHLLHSWCLCGKCGEKGKKVEEYEQRTSGRVERLGLTESSCSLSPLCACSQKLGCGFRAISPSPRVVSTLSLTHKPGKLSTHALDVAVSLYLSFP